MKFYKNIYDLVLAEEQVYNTVPVQLTDGWEWHAPEHIRRSFLMKHSQFETGKDDNKPNRNIILPILRMRYRSEGFDVKDIELFVDSVKEYYKSFLLRKKHPRWARKVGLDKFIDALVETTIDYGSAAAKRLPRQVAPEVVPWQRFAFFDQTDFLSGPKAEKHFYAPEQLLDQEKIGWDLENLKTLALKATPDKEAPDPNKKTIQTAGRYAKVYEVHLDAPESWLEDGAEFRESPDLDGPRCSQMWAISFYKNEQDMKQGITLYKGREKESPYRLMTLDDIFGRAIGLGGIEELFDPQIWTNYGAIRLKELLDSASKQIFLTTDAGFSKRNRSLKDVKSEQVLTLEDGKQLTRLDNTPGDKFTLFENAFQTWKEVAREIGSANEAIMGEEQPAGTPFALQELQAQENHALHEYRMGKFADFMDGLYRDWFIPDMKRELLAGDEWLEELSADDMQYVADSLVVNESNKMKKEAILSGKVLTEQEIKDFEEQTREGFMKGGRKKFLKIMEREFEKSPVDVYTNIAGKQKNMRKMVNDLTNVFRQIFMNPAILDDPRAQKVFNEILEYSGLSQLDFYVSPKAREQMKQNQAAMMPPQDNQQVAPAPQMMMNNG